MFYFQCDRCRVKKITTEKEILRKAVTLSKLLILSEDGENIKRVIPYQPVVIGPEYCVYVEGLSPEWDHDKVAGIFSRYGEIAHISLPKANHSGNYRGFAFIEYKESKNLVIRDRKVICRGIRYESIRIT